MRSRNIKPGFFRNADLAEVDISTRLLFIGLWCLADRRGILEDNPRQIGMSLFPRDRLDVDKGLNQLAKVGLIKRYENGGVRCLKIPAFRKHQRPHTLEKQSELPDLQEDAPQYRTSQEKVRPARSESCSLNPESCSLTTSTPDGVSEQVEKPLTDLQRVVKGWKFLTKIPVEGEESKKWDSVHFKRHASSAKKLLTLFGTADEALNCIEYVWMAMTKKGLTCTIETCVKHSDLYREVTAKMEGTRGF